MRRRLLIIASLVLATSTAVFLLNHSRAPDPIINGKPLSQWLMAKWEHTGDFNANHEAITTAGTNAVPFLLEQVERYRMPRWNRLRTRIIMRLIALCQVVLPAKAVTAIQWRLNRSEDFPIFCANAFSILGTNAIPAIPRLVTLATQKAPVERAELAMFALRGIGKETIPIFYGIITNHNLPHRAFAVSQLCSTVTPSDSAQLLPVLYSCLQDPDPNVRQVAAGSIQQIITYLPKTNAPAK